MYVQGKSGQELEQEERKLNSLYILNLFNQKSLKDYIKRTEIVYNVRQEDDFLEDESESKWELKIYISEFQQLKEVKEKLRNDINLHGQKIQVLESSKDDVELMFRIKLLNEDERAKDEGKKDDAGDNQSEDDEEGNEKSDYKKLEELEKLIQTQIKLEGVDRIKKVFQINEELKYYSLKNPLGGLQAEKNQKIVEDRFETMGSNLKQILNQVDKGVDPTRTITNDVMEIAQVLGIEAARIALMNEMKLVF